MKKFIGEIGRITPPITFVGRPFDGTGMAELSLMFTRMFSTFLPMKWLNIWDFKTAIKVQKALKRNEVVVFSEMPWHNRALQLVINRATSGKLVGIFLWDSDSIPTEFVKILENFHTIIVPSQFIQTTLKAHSNKIHVEVIPIALDTRPYQLISQGRDSLPQNPRPKIGVIASQHPRKNLNELLYAALELWEEGHDFDLHISGFLKQGLDITEVVEIILQSNFAANLTINKKELSDIEYVKLVGSLDVLISVSNGEGFNIPARQALSSGIPILISDIPGHKELSELPGVQLIASSGKIPAIYPEFGNKVYGFQNSIKKTEIKKAIRNYLILPKNHPQKISKSASTWDYRNLSDQYFNVLFKIRRNQNKVKNSNIALIGHDGGFFSVFNTLISVRKSWRGDHGFLEIYPDWRVESMRKFWRKNDFESFCYGKAEDKNIFFRLFNAEEFLNKSESEVEELLGQIPVVHSFNSLADPFLTYSHADKLCRSFGFNYWRNEMHNEVSNLKPNSNIQGRIDAIYKKIDSSTFVIGMHVRNPLHSIEQPDEKIALSRDYIKIAHEIFSERSQLEPGRQIKFLLATDQDDVVNEFAKEFGEHLILDQSVKRTISSETQPKFSENSTSEKVRNQQLQHFHAANKTLWNLSLAEDVLVDAWALSKANLLIHSVSNVSTAALYLNPKIISLPIYPHMSYKDLKILKKLRSFSSLI